ncbi:hypothetical protein [Flavobacterium turcicum]|uniref:TerB family tellurite resistance protein n=1 Tax=Flavobacterium turcicum TaxID=2764718 RepID=A0ABR7JEX8_9FLAO|nr:hypothetical protein [Flavobacterium turcicum]MBC5862870.1 hypothetical protein [Flavobacterium turcicum]NHL01602.1 hypothetical protein [Flavobacterium turcicum]
MKRIILFLLLAGFSNETISAQAKQRKVLLQQIAALQVYIGYAQKGYSITKNGLHTISDFKRGEINLHTDYFSSLKHVNSKIKNYQRVSEILSLQTSIITSYNFTYEQIQQDDLFYGNEKEYIKRVFDRVIDNCKVIVYELNTVITDNQFQMSDEERVNRIDSLYQDMVGNYSFCEQFGNQIRLLSLSRTKDQMDIKISHALQGLKTKIP